MAITGQRGDEMGMDKRQLKMLNEADDILTRLWFDLKEEEENAQEAKALNEILEKIWRMKHFTKHYVGEIVSHHGHECRVTGTWTDDDGRSGITIVPTGGYGFEVDIYDDQL